MAPSRCILCRCSSVNELSHMNVFIAGATCTSISADAVLQTRHSDASASPNHVVVGTARGCDEASYEAIPAQYSAVGCAYCKCMGRKGVQLHN